MSNTAGEQTVLLEGEFRQGEKFGSDTVNRGGGAHGLRMGRWQLRSGRNGGRYLSFRNLSRRDHLWDRMAGRRVDRRALGKWLRPYGVLPSEDRSPVIAS